MSDPRFALHFVVVGDPVAQGSIARTPHGAKHSNEKLLLPWRAAVAACAHDAMSDAPPTPVPVVLEAAFGVKRPKGHYGTGRNAGSLRASAPPFPAVNPDLDKLARAVLDALTGIAYRDDAQVVELLASKRYGTPGVAVWLTEVSE